MAITILVSGTSATTGRPTAGWAATPTPLTAMTTTPSAMTP